MRRALRGLLLITLLLSGVAIPRSAAAHNIGSGTEIMTNDIVGPLPPSPALIELVKFAMAPKSVIPASFMTAQFATYFVNRGQIDVVCGKDVTAHVTGVGPGVPYPANQPFKLIVGEAAMLPASAGCSVQNAVDQEALVYVTTLAPFVEPTPTAEPMPAELGYERLISEKLDQLPADPGVIFSAVYIFQPGDTYATNPNDDSVTTVYTGFGEIGLACASGLAVARPGGSALEEFPGGEFATLRTGDATMIMPRAGCTWANQSPELAVVLVTTIAHFPG